MPPRKPSVVKSARTATTTKTRKTTKVATAQKAPTHPVRSRTAGEEAILARLRELCLAKPDRFFRPPYVGPSGWVGVVLGAKADWGTVESLLRDAFLHVATRKLAAQLDR